MSFQKDVFFSRAKLSLFLKDQGIYLTKQRGQNFLLDQNVLEKIKNAIPLDGSQNIVEIGGGLGHLSAVISPEVKNLFVFEIDHKLIQILKDTFQEEENISIIGEDFLTHSFEELTNKYSPLSVIANVPYSITSPIIEKCFKYKDHINEMVLLVQKEFAQRIVARKGDEAYGSFSIFCQNLSEVEILFNVSKKVFFPEPKVDSAVLKMVLKKNTGIENIDFFSDTLKAIFSKRRKTVLNSLKMMQHICLEEDSVLEILKCLEIDPKCRPESIEVEKFKEMINKIYFIISDSN